MLFPPLNPPPMTILDIIGNYFLLAAGIIVFAFTLCYAVFFNWRKTPGGISIFLFVTGLDALLTHTIITRTFGGDYMARDLVRLIVYIYVTTTAGYLLLTLVRTWLNGNHAVVLPTWKERRATRRKAREARRLRRLWLRHRDQETAG